MENNRQKIYDETDDILNKVVFSRKGKHFLGEYLTMLDCQVRNAQDKWNEGFSDDYVKDCIKTIMSLCVKCLEDNDGKLRKATIYDAVDVNKIFPIEKISEEDNE